MKYLLAIIVVIMTVQNSTAETTSHYRFKYRLPYSGYTRIYNKPCNSKDDIKKDREVESIYIGTINGFSSQRHNHPFRDRLQKKLIRRKIQSELELQKTNQARIERLETQQRCNYPINQNYRRLHELRLVRKSFEQKKHNRR